MNIEYLERDGKKIAVVASDACLIANAQDALDLAMTVQYEAGADRIAMDKKLFVEEFFILSTGLAGEILQKFVNYRVKMAIYGDFSRYTSKPLRDFIYESNYGRNFFFVRTQEEAVQRLIEAQ